MARIDLVISEALEDRPLMRIADRGEILHELGSSGNVEVGIRSRCERPCHLVEPVHVRIPEGIDPCRRIAVLVQHGLRCKGAELPVIHLGHVQQRHCSICIHMLRDIDRGCETLLY